MASELRIPNAGYRAEVNEGLSDIVSGELMTNAVTLVPCGHVLNEDTVIRILARDHLCPFDRIRIERHVPNYTIRHLASLQDAQPEEEPPSAEAKDFFIKGQQYANAEDYEQAIITLLKALQLSPMYEKAKAYLDFCLNKVSFAPRAQESPQESASSSHRFPISPEQTLSKSAYTDLLLNLLEHPDIQKDQSLIQALGEHVEELMSKEAPELTPQEKERARWTEKLLGEDRKVRSFVATKLKQLHGNFSAQAAADPVEEKQPAALSMQRPPAKLPDMAFGKALWAKYFGDVGKEPPLPPNIDKILSDPCPIQEGKKVGETHLLVLVPQTVNGKPLTLKTLGELIQKPLQGNATKYSYFYLGEYKDPPAPKSHWALLSRDVIPGSRNKTYEDQKAQVAALAEKTHLPYEVPTILDATVCILMEYVRTGTRLYSDSPWNSPWTYTRCQEKYDGTWNLVVGGFAPGGLSVSDPYHDDDAYGVAGLRKFF